MDDFFFLFILIMEYKLAEESTLIQTKKIGTSKIVFQLTVMIMICVRFHAINVMEMFGKWDKSHIIEIHTHTQISSMESISQVGNIFIYM